MAITDEELEFIFANAPVEKSRFEVIELGCDWFSQTYYLQYQYSEDIELLLENNEPIVAQYAPMKVTEATSNEDMTYDRSITVNEVNDIIANELARYNPVTHKGVFPYMKSRLYVAYRDGTFSLVKFGPVKTIITDVQRTTEGALISTSLTPVNRKTTGEVATVTRVPMLAAYS